MLDGHVWPALCSDDQIGGWLDLSAGVHTMLRRKSHLLLSIQSSFCGHPADIITIVDATNNKTRQYSTVSFCDSSFYDDSLVGPLSRQTEHYRIVVRHCRNSSVLSLPIVLIALFQCACVSFFFLF